MLKSLIPLVFILLLILSTGCKKTFIPKPKGFFRIEFPEKAYQRSSIKLPYSFEYPVYANIVKDKSVGADPNWYNIEISENKAKIHLSYKPIENNLLTLTEESRDFVYKHAVKAIAINEKLYINKSKNVFGTIYEIKGNAASPMQFHLTDSTRHFIRGSLYISEVPNYDSLRPVIDFLKQDIDHLIKTFSWN